MKTCRFIAFSLVLIVNTINGIAQTENESVTFQMSRVSDNMYNFNYTWFELNTIAFTGPDGVLLVDTGLQQTEKTLKRKLQELSDGKIKYIINTHYHDDHTGGNGIAGEDCVIIGHKFMREVMTQYAQSAGVEAGSVEFTRKLPSVSIEGDVSIFFNSETIRLIPFLNSHTGCDIIVHFVDSQVLCLGDLLFSDTFPFVHLGSGGGNAIKYGTTMSKISETIPEGTRVIAGHGPEMTATGFKEYVSMINQTVKTVVNAKDSGKSLREMIDGKILDKWKRYDEPGSNFTSAEAWITTIFNSY